MTKIRNSKVNWKMGKLSKNNKQKRNRLTVQVENDCHISELILASLA